MDLQVTHRDLPGNPIPSTSNDVVENNNSDSESDTDVESGNEDEVQSSDSDSSTGNSVACPICLLKFKGQAIGFPEVCGHPFCLDCILEWSKTVQTCPYDRRKFDNILVRLDLDGEVVRTVPVNDNQSKDEEEDPFPDITGCQVCRNGDREESMLLCDRCDQGYHMDCLDPPLDEVPIEDWFCPQCDGTQAVAGATRQRAPLTLRVRRTVQRNRQIALRNSSVTKKKKKGKKRKTKYRKKTRKTNKRKKTAAIPVPRKRLAGSLGLYDKGTPWGSVQVEPGQFSLTGNRNALDDVDGTEDESIRNLISPKKQPKSLIAILAESRKAQKSIHSFGPAVVMSVPVKSSAPKLSSSSTGNPDLLGSILASQTQLTTFGKTEVTRPRPRNTNSNRVLGAILASQATLSRLDETLNRLGQQHQAASIIKLKPVQSQKPFNSRNTPQSDSTDQGSNSSTNQQSRSSKEESSNSNSNNLGSSRSNGQSSGATSSSNGNGFSGGNDGSGEDPNRDRKKKSDPEDKKDDVDEEDVDLYSDIESIEEENHPPEILSKIETEEDRIPEEEDDEKGLVIDDTNAEDSGRRSTESSSDPADGDSVSKFSNKEEVEKTENEDMVDEIRLPQVDSVTPIAPTVHKFQHGGLPAAAAALTFGPKGGVVSRPQLRPRTGQIAPPMINDLMKANLVSSITSALKETLTSALLAQTQQDSLAYMNQDEALPAPTYSETKDPVKTVEPVTKIEQPLETTEPVILVPPVVLVAPTESGVKSVGRRHKMEEIFGSDDDDSRKEINHLEQISDCEEGELDESEADHDESDEEPPPSTNRIVRMLTPPPASQKRPPEMKGPKDCEEGEIVDKKAASKKRANTKRKKSTSDEIVVKTEDCEFLRSAGIGGERKVELSLETEGIPSTFKKLDSGKTRHYRHQGDIKVVEGRGDVKPKKEPDTSDERNDKRSRRQEMKHYDVRRVVEKRSRSDRHHSSVKSERRSRSDSKSKSRDHSSKKSSKPRRKRTSSSSSSTSSSSSSTSLSSLSPERRKGKENQHKRSRSSSSDRGDRKKRKTKSSIKSKERNDDKASMKDKKKKAKKKKKIKDKHKDKKSHATSEGKISRSNELGALGTDPNATCGDDIEIPSKAVFASGDKIVVSLHFGSSSSSKPVVKKKKRKAESKDIPISSKKMKEEVRSSPERSDRLKKSQPPPSTPVTKAEPTEKVHKKPHSSNKTEQSTPAKQDVVKPHLESKSSEKHSATSDVSKGGSSSSKEPTQKPMQPNPSRRGEDVRDLMRGRGRGRLGGRPIRHRSKPVLIDIETSREIPLEDARPSDVIVLSDSVDSDEEPHLPPLPPLPPPALPSQQPPQLPQAQQQTPQPLPFLPPTKGSSTLSHNKPKSGSGKNLLFSKHGAAAVKFSLASKSNSIKKLNNPLLLLGGAEEEEEEEEQQQQQQQQQQQSTMMTTSETSSSKLQKIQDNTADSTGKMKENDNFLMNLPLPEGPGRVVHSPAKAAGNVSPIFRPTTPPVKAVCSSPLPTSTYDPSQPTHTPSSGSSTPTHSPSPVMSSVKLQQPMPPLPPPPTPPMMPSFPLPHPGAVLMPPMTSLPPPPLPPPPLLTSAPPPFAVHASNLISGIYNTSFPPPNIAGLLPLPTAVAPLLNQVMKVTSTAPPQLSFSTSIPSHGKPGRPMTPPSPTPSEGSDIFGPPSMSPSSPMSDNEPQQSQVTPSNKPRQPGPPHLPTSSANASSSSSFDSIFQSTSHQNVRTSNQRSAPKPIPKVSHSKSATKPTPTKSMPPAGTDTSVSITTTIGLDGNEECPSSAVELQVKEKFLKKLNRQERVVEEVRLALKPYYTSKRISKGDYKEILRKCVPKICHTKSGEINPIKIKEMVKGYVKKFRYQHKKEV